MISAGPQKTVFAQMSVDLTDTLRERFAGHAIDGDIPRTVHFLAPEVETTGGGKQARQSIQLLPRERNAAPALVCGFIDVGAGMAHLRSFKSMQSLQAARHGTELRLSAEAYQAFLDQLGRELAAHRIIAKVTQEIFSSEAPVIKPAAPSKRAAAEFTMLALGLIMGICVGAALWAPFSPLNHKRPPAASAQVP